MRLFIGSKGKGFTNAAQQAAAAYILKLDKLQNDRDNYDKLRRQIEAYEALIEVVCAEARSCSVVHAEDVPAKWAQLQYNATAAIDSLTDKFIIQKQQLLKSMQQIVMQNSSGDLELLDLTEDLRRVLLQQFEKLIKQEQIDDTYPKLSLIEGSLYHVTLVTNHLRLNAQLVALREKAENVNVSLTHETKELRITKEIFNKKLQMYQEELNKVEQVRTQWFQAYIQKDFKELQNIVHAVGKSRAFSFYNDEGDTIMHVACKEACYSVIEWLLAEGVDVNCKNLYGYAPIHSASKAGKFEIIARLIGNNSEKSKVDLNIVGEYGRTPLHNAVYMDNIESVKLLLANGVFVDPITTDVSQVTPLQVAAYHGNYDVAELLLQFGADTSEQPTAVGTSAVLEAIKGGVAAIRFKQSQNQEQSSRNPIAIVRLFLEHDFTKNNLKFSQLEQLLKVTDELPDNMEDKSEIIAVLNEYQKKLEQQASLDESALWRNNNGPNF